MPDGRDDQSAAGRQLVRLVLSEPAYWPLYTGLIGYIGLQATGWTLRESFLLAFAIALCTAIVSAAVVIGRKRGARKVSTGE